MDETLMPSSHVNQGIKHILHRRHDARVGGVGILQRKQVRHFLIDVDARHIVEPLLQRVEDDVLALLEVVGRTRCLTLLADDLAQIGRERPGERRADRSDSGIRRKSQRCVRELLKDEIGPSTVTRRRARLINDQAGRVGDNRGINGDAGREATALGARTSDDAGVRRRTIGKQREFGAAAGQAR